MRFLALASFLLPLILVGCQPAGNATADAKSSQSSGEDHDHSDPNHKHDEAEGKAVAGALTELKMEDEKVGTGQTVESGDNLWVRYRGTFADGEEFDSNTAGGKPLFNFQAGPNGQVIDGWKEGVIGMKVGGKRKLSVPWKMAYGEDGRGEIPPRADLYFDIELIGLIKKGEEMTVQRKVVSEGAGRAATTGDKVTITFDGKLLDGSEVEKGTFEFTLGKREVIPGIEAGVIGMKAGGERELTIPPMAGFGPMGREPAVPAMSILKYRIKLDKIG
jgi:FKBP-type peptidyl-prolyl cis-trans isomerase